jgi:hypothetical protein
MNWSQFRKTTWLTFQSFLIYLVAGATTAGAFGTDDSFIDWFQKVWIIYLLAFIVAGGNAQLQRRNDPLPVTPITPTPPPKGNP